MILVAALSLQTGFAGSVLSQNGTPLQRSPSSVQSPSIWQLHVDFPGLQALFAQRSPVVHGSPSLHAKTPVGGAAAGSTSQRHTPAIGQIWLVRSIAVGVQVPESGTQAFFVQLVSAAVGQNTAVDGLARQ